MHDEREGASHFGAARTLAMRSVGLTTSDGKVFGVYDYVNLRIAWG